jgi:hypothetical protein
MYIVKELYQNILLHNNIENIYVNLQWDCDNYNFSKIAGRYIIIV